MNTKDMIKKHISILPKGMIFTSQDFLAYGPRSAVDNCISDLAKERAIRRLARGVFMHEDPRLEVPSIFEIARAKAAAYGKEIFVPTIPQLPKGSVNSTVFLTVGQESQFETVRGPVEFKRVSPTRLKMQI